MQRKLEIPSNEVKTYENRYGMLSIICVPFGNFLRLLDSGRLLLKSTARLPESHLEEICHDYQSLNFGDGETEWMYRIILTD